MADPVFPPKKKRLPFKPTALRRTAAAAPTVSTSSSVDDLKNAQNSNDGADDLALFRRAREMAPRLAEDLERRMKKKQDRQFKEESERRRSSGGEKRPYEDEQDEEPRDVINGDDAVVSPVATPEDPAAVSVGKPRPSNTESSNPITPPPSKRSRNAPGSASRHTHHSSPIVALSDHELSYPHPPVSSRATRSQAKANPPLPITAAPITLSDSDSEPTTSHAVRPAPRRVPPREPSIEVIDPAEEDDEFNEYVLKAAAARARLQQTQPQPSSSFNNQPTTGTATSSPPPTAEILVTSSLPNSTPCKALVRYDQSLRLLRDSWAAKQRKAGLDISESNAILTWRRARVYNTSTLLHLGLRPRGDGRIAISSSSEPGGRSGLSRSYSSTAHEDGLSDDRTRVHFEAWTQETFAEMERQEASRHEPQPSSPLRNSAHDDDDEGLEEIKLRVLLRARGLPDIGLTVRPATTTETLITGFRTQVTSTNPDALAAGTVISLWFDGEQLEEHMTLEDADIADRDIIEVHLKPV